MKYRNIITKILIIIFSLVFFRITVAYSQSPENLRYQTQSLDWFKFDLSSLAGKNVTR